LRKLGIRETEIGRRKWTLTKPKRSGLHGSGYGAWGPRE